MTREAHILHHILVVEGDVAAAEPAVHVVAVVALVHLGLKPSTKTRSDRPESRKGQHREGDPSVPHGDAPPRTTRMARVRLLTMKRSLSGPMGRSVGSRRTARSPISPTFRSDSRS